MQVYFYDVKELRTKLNNRTITPDEAEREIERIIAKYPDEIPFKSYTHTGYQDKWDAEYFNKLIILSDSSASSKEFFLHMAEVGQFLNKKQKEDFFKIVVSIAVGIGAAIVLVISIIMGINT